MTDQFRELLKQRADRVADASIAEAAIRRGRKRRHARQVLAGIATLALAGGLVSGYLALQPDGAGDPTPPAEKLSVGVPGDTEVSELTAWTELPQTLVYGTGFSEAIATVVTGGQTETVELPYDARGGVNSAWAASPNGRNVAGATDEGLWVGKLDDKPDTLVYSSDTLCEQIKWAPDSGTVLVGECAGDTVELVLVDVLSGVVTPIGTEVSSVRSHYDWFSALWNADMSKLIWGSTSKGYLSANPDGSDPRPFQAGELPTDPTEVVDSETAKNQIIPGSTPGSTITAVSADGSLVCHGVSYDAGTPETTMVNVRASSTGCNYLLDVSTGEKATPDVGENYHLEVLGISLDGEVLVRASVDTHFGYRLDLFDSAGVLIDSRTETQQFEADGKGRPLLNDLFGYTT